LFTVGREHALQVLKHRGPTSSTHHCFATTYPWCSIHPGKPPLSCWVLTSWMIPHRKTCISWGRQFLVLMTSFGRDSPSSVFRWLSGTAWSMLPNHNKCLDWMGCWPIGECCDPFGRVRYGGRDIRHISTLFTTFFVWTSLQFIYTIWSLTVPTYIVPANIFY